MIKLMRESARKYPWILKSIMAVLAVAFVITMGWWGFQEEEAADIATVGDLTVGRDEYQRAYFNTMNFYRDKAQGDFKEEMMKEFVLEGLIESKLWSIAAQEFGLTVTPEELRDDIIARDDFKRNGKFDPEYYRRLLAANRLTPAMFESQHANELVRNKARMVILDSVALTPVEIAEAESLMAHQPTDQQANAQAARERILNDLLFQKQQRALLAFKEALKARTPVKIRRELL